MPKPPKNPKKPKKPRKPPKNRKKTRQPSIGNELRLEAQFFLHCGSILRHFEHFWGALNRPENAPNLTIRPLNQKNRLTKFKNRVVKFDYVTIL